MSSSSTNDESSSSSSSTSNQTPLGSLSDENDDDLDEFCRGLMAEPIVSADLPAAPTSSCDASSVDLPSNIKLLNIYSDHSMSSGGGSVGDNDDTMMQTDVSRAQLLRKLVDNQAKLFGFARQVSTSTHLISSLCQLCHLNTGSVSNDLAHFTWVQLFIQMFNILGV